MDAMQNQPILGRNVIINFAKKDDRPRFEGNRYGGGDRPHYQDRGGDYQRRDYGGRPSYEDRRGGGDYQQSRYDNDRPSYKKDDKGEFVRQPYQPREGGFQSGRPPMHSNYGGDRREEGGHHHGGKVMRTKEETERMIEEASSEARRRDLKKTSHFSDNPEP